MVIATFIFMIVILWLGYELVPMTNDATFISLFLFCYYRDTSYGTDRGTFDMDNDKLEGYGAGEHHPFQTDIHLYKTETDS